MKKGWSIEKLGDFYDITSSKRVFEADWKRNGVPFYRAREIVKLAKQGFVDNELFISEEMYNQYAGKYGIPKEGDIMVTGVGTLGICYVVKNSDRFYFKDGNIIWLKTKNTINSRFVEYAFQSDFLRTQIDDSVGATVGTYTIIKAKNTLIPVPPLPEQLRIVGQLDEAFASIAKAKANAEQNLKNARELFESYLESVFANKGDGWDEKKLRDICKVIAGQSPEGKFYNSEGNGLPFYQGKKEYGEKYIGEPTTWTTKITKEAEAGDILMSVRAPVGPVNFATQKICIGRGLAAIRAGKSIDREFLFNFLLKYENEIEGNTGAVFNSINKTQIEDIVIPHPPLSEQQIIVQQLVTLESETQKLEFIYQQKLNDLEELKKSILQKAFNGELNTNVILK